MIVMRAGDTRQRGVCRRRRSAPQLSILYTLYTLYTLHTLDTLCGPDSHARGFNSQFSMLPTTTQSYGTTATPRRGAATTTATTSSWRTSGRSTSSCTSCAASMTRT